MKTKNINWKTIANNEDVLSIGIEDIASLPNELPEIKAKPLHKSED